MGSSCMTTIMTVMQLKKEFNHLSVKNLLHNCCWNNQCVCSDKPCIEGMKEWTKTKNYHKGSAKFDGFKKLKDSYISSTIEGKELYISWTGGWKSLDKDKSRKWTCWSPKKDTDVEITNDRFITSKIGGKELYLSAISGGSNNWKNIGKGDTLFENHLVTNKR